jgi:hypothetical protein
LVPFLLALRAVGLRAVLFLAWFWGVFFSSFVADALPRAVETYFLQPKLPSLLFAVFVWSVTGSLYFMLFASAYRTPSPARSCAAAAQRRGTGGQRVLRGRLLNGSRFVGNPGLAGVFAGRLGRDRPVAC